MHEMKARDRPLGLSEAHGVSQSQSVGGVQVGVCEQSSPLTKVRRDRREGVSQPDFRIFGVRVGSLHHG